MKPTDEQSMLINFTGMNALVDAGPGTGKTTTLIEFILSKTLSIPAKSICVLMFNADIQKDFASRIKKRGLTDLPLVKTFHGFALNLLKESGHLNSSGFQCSMDSGQEQTKLARQALKIVADGTQNRKIASIVRESKTADTLLSFVGLCKAHMLPVKEVFELAGINRTYAFLIPAFYEYEKARIAEMVLFFDDWIPECVSILKKDENLRRNYQTKFQLVLIDEYQDINAAQKELVMLIRGDSTGVVAVGDVDQSIYSWRGSNPGFMLTFDKEFSPCQMLGLSQSFRYGHRLSLLANHLISNNDDRFDSITSSAPGTPETVVDIVSTSTPAGDIVKTIENHMAGGQDPSECAVLIRRWSQAMLFELSFLLRRVPYQMPPEYALPSSREIRLLTVLLTFVTGIDMALESDERAKMIYELLRFPHTYVPNTQLMDISRRLSRMEHRNWAPAIDAMQISGGKKSRLENVRERVWTISQLCDLSQDKMAIDIYEHYLSETKMEEWLSNSSASNDEFQEAKERIQSLATVLRALNLDSNMALEYFQRLILMSKAQTRKRQGVTLTTMFRAKGCEYHTVLLPYWDGDTLPMKSNNESGITVDEAEERRLAYVGMTRAKHLLKIFHSPAPETDHPLSKASKFLLESQVEQSLTLADSMYDKNSRITPHTKISERYLQKVGILPC